jgi:hypothetical protein
VGRELTAAELRELLGAYALDAVDDDECAQVERFLERSPDARHEVAQLREVASLLVQPDREAPRSLWQGIEQALEVEPPALAVADERPRRSPPWFRRPLFTRLAVVGAGLGVIALVVTVVVLSQDMSDQEDRVQELAQRVEQSRVREDALAMATDPEAQTANLDARDGERAATVVAMPDGHGYFVADDLPVLREGRTYQLWAMTGEPDEPRVVSAGILGRDPGVAAFQGPASSFGFAVTDEQAPGVERSEGPLVAEGRFG